MKKQYFLIVLVFFCKIGQGQNHVPNGNFEFHSSCPGGYNMLNLATPWMNPSAASPDYYNQCATSTNVGVPVNYYGYQIAHSGNGYAGIALYTQPPFVLDYRENIEVQLTWPLIANSCYHFEMYISFSNICEFAVENIGVHFSNSVITGFPWYPLPYIPQISNNTGLMTDTLNWNLISGEYYAVGGENFLTIGNFDDDANTNFIVANASGLTGAAYYYIDDVSLTLNPCSGIEDEDSDNEINIFPSPVTDILNIVSRNQYPLEFILYDTASKIHLQHQFTNSVILNTEQLARGLYLYEVRNKTGPDSYRVIKRGKVVKD